MDCESEGDARAMGSGARDAASIMVLESGPKLERAVNRPDGRL